jgi:hypothetical protein
MWRGFLRDSAEVAEIVVGDTATDRLAMTTRDAVAGRGWCEGEKSQLCNTLISPLPQHIYTNRTFWNVPTQMLTRK